MKTFKRSLPSIIIGIFLLASTTSNGAFAQSEEINQASVEVPRALGPESIQALVSKLDEKQTSALVELIGLLKSSADTGQAVGVIEGQGVLETVKGWFSTFTASLETNLQSFPQMLADLSGTVAAIFQEREAGGNLNFLFLLALTIGVGIAAEWLFNRGRAKKREEIRESRPEGLLKVRKIFKKIGQEMLEVPELAEVTINPFKSQGAADVTDVGIVVRGKFTTVPGGQFLIRKEAYTRVQKAFEANGIEFARKEVRIQMPENLEPANLSDNQKKAIAAASEASEVNNQAAPILDR